MEEKYDLYSKFNLEKHKQTFINYLEVCIDEKGRVFYAVPSHQEFLINYACTRMNITKDELYDLCPIEYHCDFMNWLCKITNMVSVWSCGYCGSPNEKQQEILNLFIKEEVMGNHKMF